MRKQNRGPVFEDDTTKAAIMQGFREVFKGLLQALGKLSEKFVAVDGDYVEQLTSFYANLHMNNNNSNNTYHLLAA